MQEQALLHAHRIFNEYELSRALGEPASAYVFYVTYDGVSSLLSGWHLCAPGRTINTGKAWFDKPDMLCLLEISQRLRAKDEALAEASKHVEIEDWRRSPFGGNTWVSAAHVQRVIDALQQNGTSKRKVTR
jgi:hypothetical protein